MKRYIRYLLPILIVIMITSWVLSQRNNTSIELHADQGVLVVPNDLSTPVLLGGEWMMYPNTLVIDDTIPQIVTVPHVWQDIEGDYPPFGYATYRLIIYGLNPESVYGMYVKDESTSYSLVVNGSILFENGIVGTTSESSLPEWDARRGYFNPTYDGTAVVEMTISNFDNYRGGFWNMIQLGEASLITTEQERITNIEAMTFAVFIFIGLFFLLLSNLSKSDPKARYLSIFSFLMALRVALVGNRLIYNLIPSISWSVVVRADYALGLVLFPVMGMLIYWLHYVKQRRWLQYTYFATAALILLLSFTLSMKGISIFFEWIRYVIVIGGFFFFIQIGIGLKKLLPSALMMLLAGLAMISSIISEFFFDGNQFYFIAASLAMIGLMSILVVDEFVQAQEVRKSLESQVARDPMTGVFNRYTLDKIITQGYRFEYPNRQLYLIFIDINGFKSLNDTYGHVIGDKVLIEVAHRIGDTLGKEGKVFRYGGDEFLITFEANSEEQVTRQVEHLHQVIGVAIHIERLIINISASIGFTSYRPSIEDFQEALKRSDEWMYVNKRSANVI